MKKSYEVTLEELLWRAGLAVLFCTAAVAFLVWKDILDLGRFSHPCLLRTLFGCYCPGCGGTRALAAFVHGRFLTSFFYYPMIPYVLTVFLVFMLTHTLRHLTGGRISGMRFRSGYVTVMIILFFFGWIGKNIAFLCGAGVW